VNKTPFVCVLQELKESFNYGLFVPPANGKAGKFLDEERHLTDYPFSGPVGYLEVSQKSNRIFPNANSLNYCYLSEKQKMSYRQTRKHERGSLLLLSACVSMAFFLFASGVGCN